MSYTNFCCRSGGSNLNAGTRTGDTTEPGTSASFTYASGNWVAGTGVFTVASGNPSSDGVAVGDFASVYPDGSSVAVFIGRVTARDTTTITVSLTAKAGTAPTNGTGTRTLKIGGAWKGPNAAEAFPFGFLQNTLTDSSSNPPRVNFKNAATYSITAVMTHANAGPDAFQGYTTAYDDGGRATIDGGTSGASYILLDLSSNVGHVVTDLIFQNNGASGSANGVQIIRETIVRRCVFANVRGRGISTTQVATVVECEAYGCNQSNTATTGAFHATAGTTFLRCIAHDNSGANTIGFAMATNQGRCVGCIADTNGSHGFYVGGQLQEYIGCDAYNNTGDGINVTAVPAAAYIENCNLVKNGGWGINVAAITTTTRITLIVNCGFGTGTQVNTSGTTNNNTSNVSGTVTYASNVTPWIDPANGDFRISLLTAKGVGRGTFVQTASSYAGTTAYPDIGASQHQELAKASTF